MNDQLCLNCKHPAGESDTRAPRHKKTSQDGVFLTPYCTIQGCSCRDPVIKTEDQKPGLESLHSRQEEGAEEKRNQCRYCPSSFNSKTELMRHTRDARHKFPIGALKRYLEEGKTPIEIAKLMGFPKSTIAGWIGTLQSAGEKDPENEKPSLVADASKDPSEGLKEDLGLGTEMPRLRAERILEKRKKQKREPGLGTIEELARLLYTKLEVRQIKFFRSNNVKDLLPAGTDKDRRREVITKMRQLGMIKGADNGIWHEIVQQEKNPADIQDGPGTISMHLSKPEEGIRAFVSSEVTHLLGKEVNILKFNKKGSTLDLWIDVGGEGNGS